MIATKALTRLPAQRGSTHKHSAPMMTLTIPPQYGSVEEQISAGHLAEPVSDGSCCSYCPSSASHHTVKQLLDMNIFQALFFIRMCIPQTGPQYFVNAP